MFDRHDEPIREAPLAAGLALIAVGALLMRVDRPETSMPRRRNRPGEARRRLRRGDHSGAALAAVRDGVAEVMPGNLAAGIGRSVLFAGIGLVVIRLLDRLAGDD